MSLFSGKPAALPAAADREPAPPTLESIFHGAAAEAAYAKSIFTDAIDTLVDANADLDTVEIRTTSEIDRLTDLRDAATAQRRANLATITGLKALVGE